MFSYFRAQRRQCHLKGELETRGAFVRCTWPLDRILGIIIAKHPVCAARTVLGRRAFRGIKETVTEGLGDL